MSSLDIFLLGSFQVKTPGGFITDFKSNKARALLAYLATEADKQHQRSVLAGMLWPDLPDPSALSNLRDIISILRRLVGDRLTEHHSRSEYPHGREPFFLITRDTMQFNHASDYWLDVKAFSKQACEDQDLTGLEKVISLYKGTFLEGFNIKDSTPFEEWILFKREQVDQVAFSALRSLADGYEARGAYTQSLFYARRQLAFMPWREQTHRQIMRLLTLSGNRKQAISAYESCCRLLWEELHVEPEPMTTALYEQIRDGKLLPDPGTMNQPPASIVEIFSPSPGTAALPLSGAALSEANPTAQPGQAAQASIRETIPPGLPFLDREGELAKLDCFLDGACAGKSHIIFITGDVGSGKTSLVYEFARRAVSARPELIIAGGRSGGPENNSGPYLPFREIFQMVCGELKASPGGPLSSELSRRLSAAFPYNISALLQAAPEILDSFVSRTALLRRVETIFPAGSPEWRLFEDWMGRKRSAVDLSAEFPSLTQINIFEQIIRGLRAISEQHPLLLILEDLQWADSATLGVLAHLVRRLEGSRILVVATYRSDHVAQGRNNERHPLDTVVNELRRDYGDIQINLNHVNGRRFIELLLAQEPNNLSAGFQNTLYHMTAGNPLLALDLLNGLKERGELIQGPDGAWTESAYLHWNPLPPRLEAVTAERISRLPYKWQALLSAAAVQVDEFISEVVAVVSGIAPAELAQLLSGPLSKQHRLVTAAGLDWYGERRVTRYRFSRQIDRLFLYNDLDEIERKQLHAATGQALEELFLSTGTANSPVTRQLAYHFQLAGHVEKAASYLHLSGDGYDPNG